MLGKLTWRDIPLDQPIPLAAGASVVLLICGVLIWVWARGYIPYLWREWITSVDHKRIGVMYVLLALVLWLDADYQETAAASSERMYARRMRARRGQGFTSSALSSSVRLRLRSPP